MLGWKGLSLLKKIALILTCVSFAFSFIGIIFLFTGIEAHPMIGVTFLVIALVSAILSGFIWFVDFWGSML